jgi:murein DD-endopeptidase MepM/ murein hydrolase activator NlpD
MLLMNNTNRPIKRRLGIFFLLITAVTLVLSLVYLAGKGGVDRSATQVVEDIEPTATLLLPATPVAPYAQLDPAVMDYLAWQSIDYTVFDRNLPVEGLPPLGAYVMRDGSVRLNAVDEGPLPTPFPYPTSPPLPIPYSDQTILPTLVPAPIRSTTGATGPTTSGSPETVSRTVPYTVSDGTTCAPSGNPVQGVLTQRYHAYHSGIDIGVPLDTPVIATHSGQVTYAGWSEIGYGYLVTVQSGPYITYYAHNNSFNVTQGQFVGKHSIIAWSGSTGNSSGPHVHYETRIDNIPVDPLTFSSRGLGSC